MERNTCYLNLSVAEAARTVSELVERAGLSSRMVDCHELRQGENLCGMVLLFEKYFLRMGSRLTLPNQQTIYTPHEQNRINLRHHGTGRFFSRRVPD